MPAKVTAGNIAVTSIRTKCQRAIVLTFSSSELPPKGRWLSIAILETWIKAAGLNLALPARARSASSRERSSNAEKSGAGDRLQAACPRAVKAWPGNAGAVGKRTATASLVAGRQAVGPLNRKRVESPNSCVAVVTDLTFLRRPAIGLGAGAAHQHCALTVAQAASINEGLDGLLVVDDCERPCPIRSPQAAVETPGIEHASERIPDVPERIRFPGQRAGAADLDHSVRTLGEFQHLWQFGPRLRRGGRDAGLHDAEVVDDESCVGVAIDQGGARLQVAPAQDIDRKVVANGGAQDPVEARVVRLALRLLRQHDADADRAGRILPVGDHVGHRRIVWVDRLNNGKPAGMGPLHFDRIAGIVAVQGEGGDE